MNADKSINDLHIRLMVQSLKLAVSLAQDFLKKVYEKPLFIELRERGIEAEIQAPINISYKGQGVGEYFADILVCGKIIIELKCVENLSKLHESQILNYLKERDFRSVFW